MIISIITSDLLSLLRSMKYNAGVYSSKMVSLLGSSPRGTNIHCPITLMVGVLCREFIPEQEDEVRHIKVTNNVHEKVLRTAWSSLNLSRWIWRRGQISCLPSGLIDTLLALPYSVLRTIFSIGFLIFIFDAREPVLSRLIHGSWCHA